MQKDNDLPVILLLVLAYFLLFGGKVTPGPSGPALIVVAYEESQSTPEMADFVADFQNGADGQPFKARGHKIRCLDNDTKGLGSELSSLLKPWAPFDDSKPEVIVSREGRLVFREAIPLKPQATEVVKLLQGKGL